MNIPHKLANLIVLIGLTAVISACGTGPEPRELALEGRWDSAGLSGRTINELGKRDDNLYAGTDSGIFKKQLISADSLWTAMGLTDGEIRDFIVWNRQELLASATLPEPDSVFIFKTTDGGAHWNSFQNGFGGEENLLPNALELDINKSETIWGRWGSNVAKSTDRGRSWKSVWGSWDQLGFGHAVVTNRGDPDIVWAAGTNGFFQPLLIKSTDAGETWQILELIDRVLETTVYDVILHPTDSDEVVAGLGIGMFKSTDGGERWSRVFDRAGITGLVHSAGDPTIIYASGSNAAGTLFFAASADFGDTWQMVEFDGGPSGIMVNDMVAAKADSNQVLYFGTDQGVYSYTFEEKIK